MKTFSSILSLIVIVSISAVSLFLFLDQHYNFSALLTMCWIISVALWINDKGPDEKKNVLR